MSANTAAYRLQELRKVVQAARDTEHRFPGFFVDGLNAGLDIALKAIDTELRLTREVEAVLASVNQ